MRQFFERRHLGPAPDRAAGHHRLGVPTEETDAHREASPNGRRVFQVPDVARLRLVAGANQRVPPGVECRRRRTCSRTEIFRLGLPRARSAALLHIGLSFGRPISAVSRRVFVTRRQFDEASTPIWWHWCCPPAALASPLEKRYRSPP